MLSIRLTFPAARYHGTPWGRHVNEGVAEWPPSPYRLLRALYDVWQRKCPQLTRDDVRVVLEALAEKPPRFALPPATATHTRSYLSANQLNPADKNLVFDSFLVFDRPQACFITWPDLQLSEHDTRTLSVLLEGLNYLGRSESWVQAELAPEEPEGKHLCDVLSSAGSDGELTSVACAVPPSNYHGKTPWIDALTFSTANLMKEKVSAPPLLTQVRYVRPTTAILTDPVVQPNRKQPAVQAVMLRLDSTVLPLVTSTLQVAEQVRGGLMGIHKRLMGNDPSLVSPLFSGKTLDGAKRLDHGHVYILPLPAEDSLREGRIDRILILSPLRPLDRKELDAVRGLHELPELYRRDGRPGVRCVVVWQGALDGEVRKRTTRVVSSTPFVPPRHWRKGRNFPDFIRAEVLRECANHAIPQKLIGLEILERMPGRFECVEFRRNRKEDPIRPGYALALTFADPLLAPFSIGYGSHFGLGQFQPEASH